MRQILIRYCRGVCQKKTIHAKAEEKGSPTYYLVCDECGHSVEKKHPPQKKAKPSEQYESGKFPTIESEPRAYIHRPGHISDHPCCKIHGAMLRYEHDVWRCVECGFAIEWRRNE